MLEEITQAADERSWSHAGMLLERMTSAWIKKDTQAMKQRTLRLCGRPVEGAQKSVRSGQHQGDR